MILFAQQAADQQTDKDLDFFWRRMNEQPEIFGAALGFDPVWWWLFVVPLALLTIALVVWIYAKDARTVGGSWASLLAAFRLLAFACLFVIWFLPAVREVEVTKQRSRVLMLFDVSGSMQTSDDPYDDQPGVTRRSRQDLVLQLLCPDYLVQGQEKSDFLSKILEKNPVYVYRFGQRLDPTPRRLTKTALLSPEEWADWLKPRTRQPVSDAVRRDVLAYLDQASRRLAQSDAKHEADKDDVARRRRERQIADDFARNSTEAIQVEEQLGGRTNLSAALLEMLRKESGNMIQGVIVFSDGRANAGNTRELEEAQEIARKADIPLFTVGVGRHLDALNVRLVDLAAPSRVQPDDEFPLRVVVEGENLPDNQEVVVALLPEHLNQPLPRPDRDPTRPQLEKTVRLTRTTGKLSTGAVEFTMENPKKFKGEFKYRALVKPLPGERIRGDNRTPLPALISVEERKLSVLVIASAASRDYQFLINLLIREREKFDVHVYLQNAETGSQLGLPQDKVLFTFPDRLTTRDENKFNLANYDVIVALDPNFALMSEPTQKLLYRWCAEFAGGFIYVAGPVHTFHLAREKELATLRRLLPVDLDDSVQAVRLLDRPSRDAWAVNWEPAALQMPYFNLTDTTETGRHLEGFEQFFWQEADKPVPGEIRRTQNGIALEPARRGFHTFFPIKGVKPGAQILARYGDGTNKDYLTKGDSMPGQLQPYFVSYTVEGKGPTFYIGSMETYRIRSYLEKFHERFWTKLIRQMGKGDQTRGTKRGVVAVGQRYSENDHVEVRAQIYDAELNPLVLRQGDPRRVLLTIKSPEGADAPKEWSQGVVMLPDPARPGWFTARFLVKRSGRYEIEVAVPGTLERLQARFEVETVDPERDFTRPDYALLHRLATELGKTSALNEEGRKHPHFTKALATAKSAMTTQAKESPPGTVVLDPKENIKDRLFVTLPDAVYIPPALTFKENTLRTEGKVEDLWDKGWDILWHWSEPANSSGPPLALLVILLFLSAEWLTRKLKRLA